MNPTRIIPTVAPSTNPSEYVVWSTNLAGRVQRQQFGIRCARLPILMPSQQCLPWNLFIRCHRWLDLHENQKGVKKSRCFVNIILWFYDEKSLAFQANISSSNHQIFHGIRGLWSPLSGGKSFEQRWEVHCVKLISTTTPNWLVLGSFVKWWGLYNKLLKNMRKRVKINCY